MKNNQHSLIGKIARLPKSIREKLNRRLDDGQPASEILPWLNALPRVQKILEAHFAGAPVNEPNLSHWRANGFMRWQQKQEPLARLAELGEDATDISRAGRGRLARAAATITAAQILEFLKGIPPEKRSTADLAKISFAVSTLLNSDQNQVRLKYEKTRVQQRDEQLFLTRDKHQRDVAAISLRVVHDDRIKLIESTPCNYDEKIELVGRHLFGELWEPRFLATSDEPTATAPTQALAKTADL